MDDGDSRPMKILVADDAKLVRLLIIDLLKGCPFPVSVTEAGDGTDACRQLLSGEFDIAFVDVIMPGIDGLSALELSHRLNSQTFVIIISNELTESKLQTARRFRAYEFLKKPFTEKQIIQLMESYQQTLNSRRALIVDGSATVRKIVEKILKRSFFNIDIEEAGDGQSAIEVCKDRNFDLVLIDMKILRNSGIDTLRLIKDANSDVKILLMTEEKNFKISDEIKNMNVETILYKPFSPFVVDKKLHDVFGINQPSLNI